MSLFLDAGILIAAVYEPDRLHPRARAVLERVAERSWTAVYTSDYVVAEALNFVRAKIRRRDAEQAVLDLVFGSARSPAAATDVLRVHSGRFAAALDAYARYFGKRLSFTDCTTLVLMEERRIRDLATFDRGFAGLVPVVG